MSTISSTSSNSDLAEQYAAQQAETESLKNSHEVEMDRLKKSYNAEKEDVKDRFETSIQHEKLQTYDNLRNTKKQYLSEEKQLKTAGDERIHQKRGEYQQEEERINKEGTVKVDAALKKSAALEEYQRNQAAIADTTTKGVHARNAQAIIQDSENKIEALRQNKIDVLDKRKAEHGVAVNQIKEHYDQRQNRLLAQHDAETLHIQQGVDKQINQSRLANSQRLDAHLQKQDDPFYHMNRTNSHFSDEGDYYQLSVKLPEYERKGFRVQITGHELQMSGVRSNDETAEAEPGHQVSTKSYQNFSERYQFDTPVDAKAMQTSQDGEWTVYTIPKYGQNHRMGEENAAAKIKRSDLEMAREVDFHDTLPLPTIVKDHGSEPIA